MPTPVPPQLAAGLEDRYDRVLAESILGTADPRLIHQALDAFCRDHLGAALADVTFSELSVGAGFGLALADGRRVFLKAWSAATSVAMLDAVHAVQSALAAQSFPAPRVLVMPRPFLAGHATLQEWLDRGAQADANRPALRRAMAATLARLVELAAPHRDLAGLPRTTVPADALWPPPHNALFDFEATRAGAEWIDEIAAASSAVLRAAASPLVLGHRDWRVQNLRFEGDAVSAVYDWDALAVAPEAALVGTAAATFPNTTTIPVRMIPPPGAMAAFVADYESASGRPFTPDEWRTAGAAATYLLAYVARCEHCYAAEGAPNPNGAIHALRLYAVASPENVMAGARRAAR